MKNIVEDIIKLIDIFKSVNNEDPNCIKLGKKEIQDLEDYYNKISEPESIKTPVTINEGNEIMGLKIVKLPIKSFIEVERFKNEN
jgi:hypothetical protein